MSKIKRLIEIWLYVNRRKNFNAQELANQFHVSVRTIQRDLLDLSEIGVPFYSEVGRNGGYSMLHNKILPPISFTEDETASIIFTYESLKHYQDIPYEAEIDSVRDKILAQVSEPLRNRLLSIREHIFMKLPQRTEKAPYLRTIFRASIAKQVLLFCYDSVDGCKEKKVVPIGIYADNGYWYFPAYDMIKERINLFRADSVLKLKEGNPTDLMLPNLSQWLDTNNSIAADDSCELVMRISKRAIRSNPNTYFDFSKITWEEEDTGILRQPISRCEFSYISSLVLSFGTDTVILEPLELREVLIHRMYETIELYNK